MPGPDAGCDIKNDCDPSHGECVLDDDAGGGTYEYYCRCADGFSGDGHFCKKDVIGCNIIDNCGAQAECLFDFEERGYRCKCDERRVRTKKA